MRNKESRLILSDEQDVFIKEAINGHNILVNACIGSGKTTAIQQLCNRLPQDKSILYLTYNKLLKLDASKKIKNINVTVTNYHGFAFKALYECGLRGVSPSDLIQIFNSEKPPVKRYDLLLIDEYQDIDQELSEMLVYIKSSNPSMQIIAVGDMDQKIYDKTTLDVSAFMERFLGNHINLTFTKCFRLSCDLAARLGRIWKKKIVGVNENCKVEVMNREDVVSFLACQPTEDILCLGARTGALSEILNYLEKMYPQKFNKKTVYASIDAQDSLNRKVSPKKDSAIFTTFDSCKGMERKVCVVCDYTESYWNVRINKPQQSSKILRNIFCVAASRGKERIIFLDNKEALLSDKTLMDAMDTNRHTETYSISKMFDFKYKEDVVRCRQLLDVSEVSFKDRTEIKVKSNDELIDLSPCIGIYQEAVFFNGYEIDKAINFYFELFQEQKFLYTSDWKKISLEEKILFLTSLETKQDRYRKQVSIPFISEMARKKIMARLQTMFAPDEEVQVRCHIDFSRQKGGKSDFSAIGLADVVKNDIVYELKFVSQLSDEHFLQCACYMAALHLEKGILWNIRDNSMYQVSIPDKQAFLDAVANAITKRDVNKYYKPEEK